MDEVTVEVAGEVAQEVALVVPREVPRVVTSETTGITTGEVWEGSEEQLGIGAMEVRTFPLGRWNMTILHIETRESAAILTIRPRVRNRFSCPRSLAMAAQVLLDKWAARGCDPKVLAKIRKDVFDIDVPKP